MIIEIINREKHKNFVFKGCDDCENSCCTKFSRINEVTLYDFAASCKHFPVFFLVDEKNNPVYYFSLFLSFYNDIGCPYYDENRRCTIYEDERPYTCKSYPVSMPQKTQIENNFVFAFDKSCSGCFEIDENIKHNYIKFVENDTISNEFIDKFIDRNVINNYNLIIFKTKEFIDFCFKNNLLEKLEKIKLQNGEELNLKGSNIYNYEKYRIIDPKKFNTLSEQVKKEAKEKNYIYFINLHIKSMENFNKLYDVAKRKNKIKQENVVI